MGEEELTELQDLVTEIVSAIPAEALPVEPLPAHVHVHAITWFARLLVIFARHAYLLAFLGALVENTVLLGFLLPGGMVVAFAGGGARAAGFSLLELVALAMLAAAGMTGGAVLDYYLGLGGADRLLRHRRTGRLGRALADQLDHAAPLLRHHGWWMMLVAHAFGHGRSSLAVAAGASRMPLRRFLAIEAPAALLWSALYTGGGYFLASEWGRFELMLRRVGWAGALVIIGGALAWWYWHRRVRQLQARQGVTAPAPAPETRPPISPRPAGASPRPAGQAITSAPSTRATVPTEVRRPPAHFTSARADRTN